MIEGCRDAAEAHLRDRLDVLIGKYWSPVYFHIVRHWTSGDDDRARDLTQAFFVAFLERDVLGSVEAGRGRFRTFVLTALKHFLLNRQRHDRAGKRRPEGALLSIDALREADTRFDVPDTGEAADVQFERDWKKAVLRAALERLRRTAREAGKEVLVDYFIELDLEAEGPRRGYQEFADGAGLSLSQVKNGLRWIRRQFMDEVRAEVADQVATEDDLRLELADLFRIDAGSP